MACKIKCKFCNRELTKYNGYLVNISDKLIKELHTNKSFQALIKVNFNGKVKHFVMCSKCLFKVLGRHFILSDYKFKNNHWFTSNISHLIRLTKGEDYLKKIQSKLESLDNKGIVSYTISETNELLKLL